MRIFNLNFRRAGLRETQIFVFEPRSIDKRFVVLLSATIRRTPQTGPLLSSQQSTAPQPPPATTTKPAPATSFQSAFHRRAQVVYVETQTTAIIVTSESFRHYES